MKISVIVPSYNQGRFLEKTLKSVFAQHEKPHEIFVLDGGSTDNTIQVIRRYESKLTWWRSHKDSGQAAAVNEGIRRASGDIIAWINSDDMYMPNAFGVVSEMFSKGKYDILTGSYLWTDEFDLKYSRYDVAKNLDFDDFSDGVSLLNQPATFFTKSLWESIGFLDESLHYGLDVDFFIKCYRARARFCYVNDWLAINRIHHVMKSKDPQMELELFTVAKRHFGLAARQRPQSVFMKLKWRIFQLYGFDFLIRLLISRVFSTKGVLPGVSIRASEKRLISLRHALCADYL